MEPELLPQGFTSASFGAPTKTITKEQALSLSRAPSRALGIRGAYRIRPTRKKTAKKRTAKKKTSRRRKTQPTKRYELKGLNFNVPKGLIK
jgi:hypothetical protein